MRRLTLSLLVLVAVLAATPAFALTRTIVVVDEVIRMTKAGVGDDEIIAFVRRTPDPFEVNGDDVIAMSDAHVSKAVIKAVIDESAARAKESAAPARRSVVVAPSVYVPGFYPYYYDPYWYQPRFYLGIGFGSWWGGGHFRSHHRGHLRHR